MERPLNLDLNQQPLNLEAKSVRESNTLKIGKKIQKGRGKVKFNDISNKIQFQ